VAERGVEALTFAGGETVERDGDVLDAGERHRSTPSVGRASSDQLGHEAMMAAGQALAYSRLAPLMQPALVNGAAGAVAIVDGEPFAVGAFTVRGGKIVEIDILADPARLRELDLTILDK
jgi:hypothetical protein